MFMENNFFKDLVDENTISEKKICEILKVSLGELYHMFIFFALPAFFYNGQIYAVKSLLEIWISERSKGVDFK